MTKEIRIMRKGINRSVIIAMAAMLSAGMLSACGQKSVSGTGGAESAVTAESSETAESETNIDMPRMMRETTTKCLRR